VQEPAIGKYIIPKLPKTIHIPHGIDLALRVAVKHTEVQIAAGVIDSPIGVVCVEDAVDNQICKCEEECRYSTGVLGEFISLQERIENEARIRKSRLGRDVRRRNGTRIRRTCLTKGRE